MYCSVGRMQQNNSIIFCTHCELDCIYLYRNAITCLRQHAQHTALLARTTLLRARRSVATTSVMISMLMLLMEPAEVCNIYFDRCWTPV